VQTALKNVRLEGNNGHDADVTRFLLIAQSGHAASGRSSLSAKLLFVEKGFFQELRPEILRRSGNAWSTLRRKVHEIPIRPDRVDVICRQFSSPEMENLPILFPKYMHHRPLHIIGISLASVVGLVGGV